LQADDFVWNFESNPIGYQGHGWTMSDYNSAEFQALLKSLIIKPKWYDYAGWGFETITIGLTNSVYYNNHYIDYE
jgi:hypothetical protein